MTFASTMTNRHITNSTVPNLASRTIVNSAPSKAVNANYDRATTAISKVSGFIIGAAFMTMMGIGANTSQNQVTFKSKVPENRSRVVLKGRSPNLNEDGVNFTSMSEKLQKSFNFNTVQWAWVLKVERKTIYNWIKNPSVKVHSKASERLTILDKFNQEMTPGHRAFLSKLTFGKRADRRFIEEFSDKNINIKALVDIYEDIYTTFDGMYKRQKTR